MRIRPAVEGDLSVLAALAKRTWLDAFGGSVSPEAAAAEIESTRSEAYFRSVLDIDTILVADEDGELVGYAKFGHVRIPEVDTAPRDRGLHRLYVDTGRQGEGIGRALLDAALSHPDLRAAPRVYVQVWKENRKAVEFYESYGFQTVGTTRVTIGYDEVGDDLVMVLARR